VLREAWAGWVGLMKADADRCAVNISAVEFRHPHFLEHVRTALNDSRLDPAISNSS